MEKTSLKFATYNLLKSRYPNYIHGGELERFAFDKGYMADNIGRRLRELRKEGSIESMPNEQGHTLWRYKKKVGQSSLI